MTIDMNYMIFLIYVVLWSLTELALDDREHEMNSTFVNCSSSSLIQSVRELLICSLFTF